MFNIMGLATFITLGDNHGKTFKPEKHRQDKGEKECAQEIRAHRHPYEGRTLESWRQGSWTSQDQGRFLI